MSKGFTFKVKTGHNLEFTYDIEVSREGKIAFNPKAEGVIIPEDLTKLAMPPRAFWEEMANLLYQMDYENVQARNASAITKLANDELQRQVDALAGDLKSQKKRLVYVGTNRKNAFMAGVTMGRRGT